MYAVGSYKRDLEEGIKMMIDLINLTKWKKQAEILTELHREYGINLTSREWRSEVEKNNKRFAIGEAQFYITHSNSKGFKATRDYQEAKIGRNDYVKRAINMLRKARECDKAFKVINNLQMDFEEGEIK